MSPLKRKRYDKLMKLYQTLAKQDKNKAESIKNTGKTSANDTEDKRIVGKNDKGEKVVKGTVMGNLKSNEAARNAKVEKPKLRPKKAQFSEDSEIYKKKEGKMKPVVGTTKKKVPMKKKSKSNIANSSSYNADFTKKGLEKRGLKAKNFMSKENYAKTTSAKNKKNAAGQDFGQKKKKAEAPMYESKGTMGGVKKSKYYSKGGTVFTGR
jgi:hypothetical protein